MCVVSMIGDHYHDKWKEYVPQPPIITPNIIEQQIVFKPLVTQEEFLKLKEEVLEMKELLKKAIAYDERNNEPHCEIEEKIATLKKIAEMVGVSLDDVFNIKSK